MWIGFKDLISIFNLLKYKIEDKEVANDSYIDLAMEKGLLTGPRKKYTWLNNADISEYETKGTHKTAFEINKRKRVKYRIVRLKNTRNPAVLAERLNGTK